MVGTNTTRSPAACQRDTCSRTAAIVVAVSIGLGDEPSRMEFVLGRGIALLSSPPRRSACSASRLDVAPSMKFFTKRGLRPEVMSSTS